MIIKLLAGKHFSWIFKKLVTLIITTNIIYLHNQRITLLQSKHTYTHEHTHTPHTHYLIIPNLLFVACAHTLSSLLSSLTYFLLAHHFLCERFDLEWPIIHEVTTVIRSVRIIIHMIPNALHLHREDTTHIINNTRQRLPKYYTLRKQNSFGTWTS